MFSYFGQSAWPSSSVGRRVGCEAPTRRAARGEGEGSSRVKIGKWAKDTEAAAPWAALPPPPSLNRPCSSTVEARVTSAGSSAGGSSAGGGSAGLQQQRRLMRLGQMHAGVELGLLD